jgi:Cu+-exporting ATPase
VTVYFAKKEALIIFRHRRGHPCTKNAGEIVYAGGKQLEGNIEVLTIKEVAQSYLTSLWNREELKTPQEKQPSFIHLLSRYFTWVVLSIAIITATYWWAHDPSRIWHAVTAVLIVACPCALLLAASFTNGHILRILSRHHLYLRNADAIERLAEVDHIVFDKTGTLTVKPPPVYLIRACRSQRKNCGLSVHWQHHPLIRSVR